MGWFTTFTRSSIGKKFIMALTGSLLMIFLIIHFIGNMMLYFGPKAFDTYVDTLETIKPLIRVIEVLLALIFIFHIYNGIKLWYENKKANPKKYAVNASRQNTDIYSRTMAITGVTIFVFLIIHLSTFWATFNFGAHPNTEYPYYTIVTHWFQNPFYSLIYIIGMIVLGYHLNHAFESAFQTFGWNHKRYTPLIKKIGTIYALILAIGFASIPIYFFLMGGK